MSSIKRSVQVMDLLARKSPLGVRAIAAQLALPLGSVHRLLLDLEEEGIAERTPDGEWELSFRLLEITGSQLERIELPRLARPYAERIAQATGETVNLNALSGRYGVCIDKVRGNEGMQLDMRIGARGPLHCGGAGKAMLAYMSADEQARVLEHPLVALTPKTMTDLDVLKAELVRIKARGYSIDDQEVVIGVYCVSVPILDRNGHPAGSMSITGPSVKTPGADILPKVALLNEACGAVSRRIGYLGAWPLLAQPVMA
ncbi:IclR family transcriptional regulator [uncultured Devosia sp.]|uniref:IclR family transcriptional regulator n=1 Tax=uncultured Devosia sp. TaxID=211434 RepID=UPI0035CA1529